MKLSASTTSWLDLFRSCRVSAVHLEMRDAYAVKNEVETLAAWRAGNDPSRTDPAYRRDWLDLVEETVSRGVEIRRARIVSEPVSEYIKYEHAGTQLNIDAGEQVRWLGRHRATGIALPANDFWIYDGQLVEFNLFDGHGRKVGQELTEDPDVVRLCVGAFEAVWDRAVPHKEYEAR
ncbi:DUF6879 family protein [Streptomyces sp. NPDC048361]|uniref:DUF6879 family protein n=1 Tax=Streptomyces sp. NPDC048361 TaxID=3154720 RepID=UPI0034135832